MSLRGGTVKKAFTMEFNNRVAAKIEHSKCINTVNALQNTNDFWTFRTAPENLNEQNYYSNTN